MTMPMTIRSAGADDLVPLTGLFEAYRAFYRRPAPDRP